MTPTLVEIEDHLKTVEKHRRRMLKTFCDRIFKMDVKSEQFIKDKLTDYAKRSAFIDIFQGAQTLYNTKMQTEAYEHVMKGIGELYTINFKEDAAITISQFEEIRQIYLHSMATSTRRIPTNIEPLDEILRGGLEKGELGILVAEPKKGKSIGLIHMGAAALMMRRGRVAHFVLEGTTEQAVLRYQTRLTEIMYRDLESDTLSKEQRAKLQGLGKRYMNRLDLIPFNQHWTYTALDVESKIKELKRAGREPDLVIIDYGDLLKHHEQTDNARMEQTEVFRALKRIAMMQSVAIWTASQARRPADNDKEYILRSRDIAECIGRGSLVLTEKGHVPIEEVEIGVRVLTHTGQWKRVTNKWNQGVKKTIAFRPFGRLPVPMTPDHLVYNGKKFVESKDVKRAFCPRFEATCQPVEFSVSEETGFDLVDGYCGVLNKRIYYGRHSIRNGVFSKKTAPIKNRIPLNNETAWLFGFILAEGCVCNDDRTVVITSPELDRVKDLIEKYFDLEMKLNVLSPHCKELRITNLVFNAFLTKIMGRGSQKKFVHPKIFTHDFGGSFVDGVDSGDGYEGHKRLSLSNKKVVFDLSAMLHARGLSTFISPSKKEGYDDCYVLSWSKIGAHSLPTPGGYTLQAHALPMTGKIEVWDLEVEDDHSFVVEGIAVHNCFEKVRIADLVCTLNQTQRERRHGIMRFCVDIYRSADTDKIIRLVQDYERMIFYSKRLGHVSKDEAPSWTKS